MIAQKLGKTLFAPVLPSAVNATGLKRTSSEMDDHARRDAGPGDIFKQVQRARD